jgi:hypothetical protein
MVTLFHWTTPDRAESILRDGFIETSYKNDPRPRGVHLCACRGAEHETGNPVRLAVELPADELTPDRLDPIQYPTCLDYIIPASVIKTVGIVRDDSSA